MSNVVRFPASRHAPATTIPREEFSRLAEMALDVVDQIVRLLDDLDAPGTDREPDVDLEPDADGEPSLGAPEGQESQIGWLRGSDRDGEAS